MSRHHIMPTAVYTPPPPRKAEKKRRIGIGQFGEVDETEEAREAGGPTAPAASRLSPHDFAEIEDAISKARPPSGRLSQATLAALLRAQEFE